MYAQRWVGNPWWVGLQIDFFWFIQFMNTYLFSSTIITALTRVLTPKIYFLWDVLVPVTYKQCTLTDSLSGCEGRDVAPSLEKVVHFITQSSILVRIWDTRWSGLGATRTGASVNALYWFPSPWSYYIFTSLSNVEVENLFGTNYV